MSTTVRCVVNGRAEQTGLFVQLPAAGCVGEHPVSQTLLHCTHLLLRQEIMYVSQDEVDRYPMKQHDKLQTDGDLCPYHRWALSSVLPVKSCLHFGAAEFVWKVMVAVGDGGDGSAPAAGLCPQHHFGTTLSAHWFFCS